MLNRLMKNKKGFTLIELIVVIAILGILAAVLVPSIGNYVTRANQARCDSAAGELLQAARRLQTEMDAQLEDAPDSLSEGLSDLGFSCTVAVGTAVTTPAPATTYVYISGSDTAPTKVNVVYYVDGTYNSTAT